MTCRQLVSDFLAETRKTKGLGTAKDYGSRLQWVLSFAEQTDSLRRWPMAADIDRDFVIDLRAFLNTSQTTRNGRAGGAQKPLSTGYIRTVLECLRTLLNWASKPLVGKLPAGWLNPASDDLVGHRQNRDPLRPDVLPQDARIGLVHRMDRWQLCHCCFSMVMPMRPDEVAGLLISDVDFGRGWFKFRTRFGGSDFNKEQRDFVVPFPVELVPMIHECIGGRLEGPLLRSRAAFEQNRSAEVTSFDQLKVFFQGAILSAGDQVQCEQDRKDIFRRLLRDFGGVSEDELYRELAGLFRALGFGPGVSLKSLRSAVSTDMKNAGINLLELRYLTSHTVDDIMNVYVNVDPVGAMEQYFRTIQPLLTALKEFAETLGIGQPGSNPGPNSAVVISTDENGAYNTVANVAELVELLPTGCTVDASQGGFFVVHGWCTNGAQR
jgi:integrase